MLNGGKHYEFVERAVTNCPKPKGVLKVPENVLGAGYVRLSEAIFSKRFYLMIKSRFLQNLFMNIKIIF